jgi:drug/metabolite transporter (DMT)-like permease
MFLFHEPPNPWIMLGIALTIAGILCFDRPADGGEV